MIESLEHCARERLSSKGLQHFRMREDVHRVSDTQLRKPLSAKAIRLPLVNEWYRVVCDCVSDGRGFTVVQRAGRGSDHKFFKMRHGWFAKPYDLDEADSDKLIQKVRILPIPAAPLLKLGRDDINDRHAIGQCGNYFLGAARRIQVDDSAGVSNDHRCGVSQAG